MIFLPDPADQFHPVHNRHFQVCHNNIRMFLFIDLQSLFPIRRIPDHFHIKFLPFHRHFNSQSYEDLILHDQYLIHIPLLIFLIADRQ